jgi:hypothetical protein
LGLRVPQAEPFEEPPAPPPQPVAPPRAETPPPAAPSAARAGSAPRGVSAPRAAVTAARAPAPRATAERRDEHEPPPAALPRAGLSRSGKLAVLATLVLLGGAAVGVLLLYNPSEHLPRPRTAQTPAPTGSLYVTSRPAGAAISINGKPTGRRTPDTIEELPANRTLKLELALEGYQPWSLEVSVSGEDPTPVMAELTREGGGRGPKTPGREPGRRRGPP